MGRFRGRAERGTAPLFLGFILKTIVTSFERYCAIRVVLWIWAKVALSREIFSAPSF